MRLILTIFLTLLITELVAQTTPRATELMPLKFIDKVEIFAGPSLSFNYGNKFVENYKDDFITNKRLNKIGYTLGLGIYHELNNRLNINARFSLDQKGTKSELNHPLNPVNDNTRQIITSEYTYSYSTFALSCHITIDNRARFSAIAGGYLGKIGKVNGSIEYYDQNSGSTYNNFRGRLWQKIAPNGGINSSTFIPGLNSVESIEYGVTFGFTYNIYLGKSQTLSVNLIDGIGLTNIYNNDSEDNLSEKNHTVSLLISYVHKRPFKKAKI